jgi:uncharacterized protein (DUF1330 family)
MKAYAIAHLRNTTMGQPIATYLARIDATLTPYQGRFLVHGGALDMLEGAFDAALVILEFPNAEAARAWYQCDAYQAILPLRTGNTDSTAFVVQGVPDNYRATDVLG